MSPTATELATLSAELAAFGARLRARADFHASPRLLNAGMLLKLAAEELEAAEVTP